jgi:hypothetical protein
VLLTIQIAYDMSWTELTEGAQRSQMSMLGTLGVLNELVARDVIKTYAIAGAVAAYAYIEPTVTDDLDILITLEGSTGLISLEPILAALRAMGYTDFHHEGIMIEDWAVQFLPVSDALDAEALRMAEMVDVVLGGTPMSVRVLRPEHLVAKALQVGRPKDMTRIIQFLEERAVDMIALHSVLERFNLNARWLSFCQRMNIDPGGGNEQAN